MNGDAAQRHPLLGVALIVVMAACFAAMDTAIRWLGTFLPVLLLLWCRFAIQTAVMGAWLARSRRHGFRSAHPRFQALRGALLLATSTFNFFGVQHMPVPEFTAIGMLTPLIVTLLAAWLLREQVSPLRWLLVGGGFAGALIVIRPGSGLFGWFVLLPLASACTYASFQVLTGRLSALESPYTTHFWTGCIGMLLMTPPLLASGIDAVDRLAAVEPRVALIVLTVGALGTVGHLLLILATRMAPTSTLMPFTYTQIVWAAGLGWLAFGQLPDRSAWIGMAVIAACGAATAWLNVRRAAGAVRRSRPAAQPLAE